MDAPKGRDIFTEDLLSLPVVPITWDLMKRACKFAFYQSCRKKHYWTQDITKCYLKHCGLSSQLSASLYDSARACCAAQQQEEIDYTRKDGIGRFRFHSAWLNDEVSIRDFVEAIMHHLFLGAAESNYELIGIWLKNSPAAAKIGYSPFQRMLQNLIVDLRGFNLSWLLAYPLTGQSGKLGTGSWVAENWVFFCACLAVCIWLVHPRLQKGLKIRC